MRLAATLVLALCTLPGLSFASTIAPTVVITDGAGVSTASALGSEYDSVPLILFEDNLGSSSSCTGALISSTTVLTAKHCLPSTETFTATAVFTDGSQVRANNTTSIGAETIAVFEPFPLVSLTDGTDLAILTLDTAMTALSPLKLAAEVFVGELARIVGYGRIGVGSTGSNTNAFFERRAAENVIDGVGTAYDTSGNAIAGSANILSADFDNPTGTSNTMDGPEFSSSATALANEGIIAQGDSGGPLLVQRDGEWVVAGVASAISNAPGSPGVFDSTFGTIGYWTGVVDPIIRTEIEGFGLGVTIAPVPVPASVWLLGLGVAGLWGAGRRSKRAS